LVQRQSRDQRTLDVLLAGAADGKSKVILSDSSDTWVNLHNDLRVLADGKSFIWKSERSGYAHLELRAIDGSLIRPLTSGPWVVDNLLAIDGKHRRVYFAGNADDPREKHVYSISLDTRAGFATQISFCGAARSGVQRRRASCRYLLRAKTHRRRCAARPFRQGTGGTGGQRVEGGHPYGPIESSQAEFGR
jgi:dipeptidyl-peptidase-4